MLDFPAVSRDLSGVGKDWKALGRAVRHARTARGWTQQELADEIAKRTEETVSTRTLGTLERGGSVDDTTIYRAAFALDWPPGRPQAILDGLQPVGLAGELLPATGIESVAGNPAITRGVTSLATAGWNDLIVPPATLPAARQTVADHERDFTIAAGEMEDLLFELRLVLTNQLDHVDPLDLAEQIAAALDKIVTFDQGRRYWQRQVDLLRRQEPDEAIAARRGASAKSREVTHDDPA